MTALTFVVRLSIAAIFAVVGLQAQCTTTWQAGDPLPGVNGTVFDTVLWDPDGPGSMHEVLVVGGAFTHVGTVEATNLAIYDWATDTWTAFGTGAYLYAGNTYGSVTALTVMPNGDLAIGGRFNYVDGVSASNVAVYDGVNWQSLNAPSSSSTLIEAIVGLPGGEVIVAGDFNWFSQQATNVAMWSGGSWSGMGINLPYDEQWALHRMANGDVVMGGDNGVRLWDGSNWTHIGVSDQLINSTSTVRDFLELPSGDLLVFGRFDIMDAQLIYNVARWDGVSWHAYAPGVDLYRLRAAAWMANGDLCVVSDLTTGGMVRRWDGSAWHNVGGGLIDTRFGTGSAGLPGLYDLQLLPSGLLLASGNMHEPRIGASGMAIWDATTWSPLAPGTVGTVSGSAVDKNGALMLGGNFWGIAGHGARGVALYDGTAWTTFDTSTQLYDSVTQITRLANGDLVAIGDFTSIDGVPANNVARWDGTAWSAYGTGVNFSALDVLPLGEGRFAICGNFDLAGGQIARRTALWDGTDWKPMGNIQTYVPVQTMARLPSGDVLGGGDIETLGSQSANHLIVWDGLDWQPFALGADGPVDCLQTLRDGRIVAAGAFTTIGGVAAHRVAIYDGSSWSPLGIGVDLDVADVLELPDGDLLFLGREAPWNPLGGFAADGIARWDGQTWSQVDGGCAGTVASACLWGDEVIITGSFLHVGNEFSSGWARLATDCPAAAVTSGVGCNGSFGSVALTTTELPWIGSSFDASVSGTAPGGLAFVVFGDQMASLSLASVIAEAQPGCDLLVQPQVVEPMVVPWGGLTTSLAIPNATALVGAQLFEQVVPFEFDASGTLLSVTASNRLDLTIGAL